MGLARNQWENVTCPVCPPGAERGFYLSCSDRLREPRLFNYRLVRCTGCGLIYLDPRPKPSSGAVLYREEGYDPFLSLMEPEGLFQRSYRAARKWTMRWKKRLVKRLAAPGTAILDVGCGTGEFLREVGREYGAWGIEPEPEAARWARERFGLNVQTGDLSIVQFPTGSFDLVTMWHVLEHIPDPAQALTTISGMLKDGGRLLVALPNISALDARLYRAFWVAIDAPRHLWHFDRPQLARLAEKTGFTIVRTGMMPLDLFYNAVWSERFIYRVRGWRQLLPAVLRLPLAVAASLVYGGVTGKHSGNYYVLEKKKTNTN